jgi:hypothetical protein
MEGSDGSELTPWRLLDAPCVLPAPSAHLSHRGHGCKARSGTGSAAVSGCARRRLRSTRAAAPRSRSAASSAASGWAMLPRALEDGAGQRAGLVSPHGRASRAEGERSAREEQSSRCAMATPSVTNGEAAAGGAVMSRHALPGAGVLRSPTGNEIGCNQGRGE